MADYEIRLTQIPGETTISWVNNIAVLTGNRLVVAAGQQSRNIWQSLDGGETWMHVATLPYGAAAGLRYDPAADRIWALAPGYLLVSEDAGVTWATLPHVTVEIEGTPYVLEPYRGVCLGTDGAMYWVAYVVDGELRRIVLVRQEADGTAEVLTVLSGDIAASVYRIAVGVAGDYRYLLVMPNSGPTRLYELDGSWQPTLLAETVAGIPAHILVDPRTGDLVGTGGFLLVYRRKTGLLSVIQPETYVYQGNAGFTADGRLVVVFSGTTGSVSRRQMRVYSADGEIQDIRYIADTGGNISCAAWYPPGSRITVAYRGADSASVWVWQGDVVAGDAEEPGTPGGGSEVVGSLDIAELVLLQLIWQG